LSTTIFLPQESFCPVLTIALVSPIISFVFKLSPAQAVMKAAISILEYCPSQYHR
jgi:hypothetical protein